MKIWNLLKYSDNTAIQDESGFSLSYQMLNAASKELMAAVTENCFGNPHCLVFNMCDNVVGSLVGYVSFLNSGCVPIMLKRDLDEELLSKLFWEYKPAFFWAPFEDSERVLFKNMEIVYRAFDYVLLKTQNGDVTRLFPELGLLLTTSGSTGSPKFVRQSYCNILDNANSIVEYLKLDETECPITTLPMSYTYGLSIINSHLLVGAKILLTKKTLFQREFWDFFKKAGATSFGGVPYTFEMLDRLRFYRMDLPSLRTMTQAGGKILPELHERFAAYARDRGKNFIVMYGQCEATARMGFLPAEKAVEKKGSMGIPIPGGKFYLLDELGNEVTKPYSTGELVYEGKNVTMGYAECGGDLEKGDERHGVLETGDMAQFDDDGFYYIVGRKKRFLKVYGNRLNLDELDQMIKSQFRIEVASAGMDDHVYIFLTDKDKLEEVREFVVKKTKLNFASIQTKAIEDIPKSESGKVLYNELKKYYV